TYVLDIAAGLTQVLADEEYAYLYGVGRISQHGAGSTDFFLGDALGLVRQLADEEGEVRLTRSYRPYGEAVSGVGEGETSYGFAGEWVDGSGLVFLRARYYAPQNGRFISKDTWPGDYSGPYSLHKWNYAFSNPVNVLDPSGMAPPPPTPPIPPTPPPPAPEPKPRSTPTPPGYTPLTPTVVRALDPCVLPFPPSPPSRGYMEGRSFASGVGSGTVDGYEIVYDFATMTRARFLYSGDIGGFVWSAGASLYAGNLWGFRWNKEYDGGDVSYNQIVEDYKGLSEGFYVGVGVIPVIGGGGGYFRAVNSEVKGVFSFLSVGFSIKAPGEMVGFISLYELDKNTSITYYADKNGKVNRARLIGDILTGNCSPAGLQGTLFAVTGSQRVGAITTALLEAQMYEAYTQWYGTTSR
ncbi:MAG: RHS repeat-associated core domain-containing protein, partial [Anaerolineales bacterium]|nr:RHS repeat-associated core domain-containing protein [Anaerolineales bacterium]